MQSQWTKNYCEAEFKKKKKEKENRRAPVRK